MYIYISFFFLYIYIHKEEGSQNKYVWKNPQRASVHAETRTYGTDSPSRQKPRALSITPLHYLQKMTAQGRTSSTHDSIHTGVIGRCLHVHLTHQIHGVADLFPRCRRATSETVEAPNPWRHGREIYPQEEGSQYTYK